MKDLAQSFRNMTMFQLLLAMRENALRSHVKKLPKQYAELHRHPGIRNPKIAAQMNAMHDHWYAARFGSNLQAN